jgi:acetyl esterase/lipase
MAFGMPTSELPLLALVVQVLGTIAFAAVGAFDSAAGVVGLLVSLVSWVGLLGLHREARRSDAVLEQALEEGLGERFAEGLPSDDQGDDEQPSLVRQVLLPSRGARNRYCTDRDIAYGDGGAHNQLDVWRRPDLPRDGQAPVLLELHGGAWVSGRKDDQAGPLLTHLAARGWVCVTANYRLSPAATWPDHMVDVKRAIGWVRANIGAYGGDPSFLAVTGGSAGGHLSALAALTANDPAFQPGFEEVDTTVQAAVPIYGLYDLTGRTGGTRPDTIAYLEKKVFKTSPVEDRARWEAGSPICRVRADAPPFLVIHGANDSFLPVEQARAFVAELRSTSSAPVAFVELPRTQHVFDGLWSVRAQHTVQAVEQFLTHVRVGRRSGPAPAVGSDP